MPVIDVRTESSTDVVYRFDDSDDVVELSNDAICIVSGNSCATDRRELVDVVNAEDFIKAVMMAANIKEVKL